MAKRQRRNKETILSDNWKTIWNSREGRLAISELLVATNVYSEILVTDPVRLALAVGERNVGARIARMVGLKPENYVADATEAVDVLSKFMESAEY